MQQWNKVFKKEGFFFTEPQEDMPKITAVFKKHRVKKALDLGCGSGRHTVYLAKRGFEVWGFDVAPEGVKLTREWLRRENLTAKLKLGSIYDTLPYRNETFDAIVSTQTLHHAKIEDIRKAIREMERILRPRGLIFLTLRKGVLRKHGDVEFIAPRTYIPLCGDEEGLPHFLFDKRSIRKEFSNFSIPEIWFDEGKRHYCFLGELKKTAAPVYEPHKARR